jgi:hypothetical protein
VQGIADDIMAGSSANQKSKTMLARSCEAHRRMAKKGMTEGWLKKKWREYQIAEGRVITAIDGEL